MLLKNEWQVTGYRSLNSHGTQFHFFSFAPAAKIHFFHRFYGIKVDQIKAGLELQSFIALPLSFLFTHFPQMISCICFPQTVSFLAAVFGSLLKTRVPIKWEVIKVVLLLNSNKLTVTFWVHCFSTDAGLSVIFCFYIQLSISSKEQNLQCIKKQNYILCLLSVLSNCVTVFWHLWEGS